MIELRLSWCYDESRWQLLQLEVVSALCYGFSLCYDESKRQLLPLEVVSALTTLYNVSTVSTREPSVRTLPESRIPLVGRQNDPPVIW